MNMFPDDELRELKDRVSQKSDRELLQMVEVEYDDYRAEALELAKAELTRRNVPFEAREQAPTDSYEDESDRLAVPAEGIEPCANCGGTMRAGLLFADKELTLFFTDGNEERFVQAYACRRCGEVRLVVDFATDVEG